MLLQENTKDSKTDSQRRRNVMLLEENTKDSKTDSLF